MKRAKQQMNDTTTVILNSVEKFIKFRDENGSFGSQNINDSMETDFYFDSNEAWSSVYDLLKHLTVKLGLRQPDDFAEWTFWGSVFYSATVCTSIGYGNMAPKTVLGRSLTMLYAVIGIPLVLYTLSFIGKIEAKVITYE